MICKYRIWAFAFTFISVVLAGPARATTIFDPEPTGVSTGVFLEVRGDTTTEQNAGANLSSSSAANPTGSPEASGTALAKFPNPNGTGGSVAAKSSAGSAAGVGAVRSTSSSLFLGEFTADDGDPLTSSFDITVDLGIDGFLSVSDNNSGTGFSSSVTLAFSAVKENPADPDAPEILGSFAGNASLSRPILSSQGSQLSIFGFDASGFSSSTDCTSTTAPAPAVHGCTVTANTIESVTFNVTDGELFGLFLSLTTSAFIDNGFEIDTESNFFDTVELSFPQTLLPDGIIVTSQLPSFQEPSSVPEPTTLALLGLGLVGVGFARRRNA